jgi:Lipocalin-like domain
VSIEAEALAPSAGDTDLRSQLIGTWRLMSAEDKDDDTGEWVPYTFGNPPSGYFIYDASGYASVQIMPTPPKTVVAPDILHPKQSQEFVSGFISYYGKWTIDATYITVQAEGNLAPSGVGKAQQRPYTLDGDTLTIGNESVGYIRTLQRVV